MRSRTIIMTLLVIVVALFTLPACKKGETSKTTPSPQQAHQQAMLTKSFEESKKVTAVRVNGAAITEFYVLREMNAAAPQYLKPGQSRTPELDAKIRRDAIDLLITQELAVQEAKKRGIRIQPAVIDEEMKKIKARTGSDSAFQEYLRGNGLTQEELKKTVEKELLFDRIALLEVDNKVSITDAALRVRYEREKAGMKDAPHRQMTFEAAKGMLEQRMRAEAMEKRMKAWERELRKNARIEIIRE